MFDTIIADGGPSRIDAAAERGFRYDASLPDGSEQILAAHHAFSVADQIAQKIEYLWFHGLKRTVPYGVHGGQGSIHNYRKKYSKFSFPVRYGRHSASSRAGEIITISELSKSLLKAPVCNYSQCSGLDKDSDHHVRRALGDRGGGRRGGCKTWEATFMAVQALGYLGISTQNVEHWSDCATRQLGLQLVDRAASCRAFRMDDRRQRLIVDRERPDAERFFGWEVAGACKPGGPCGEA